MGKEMIYAGADLQGADLQGADLQGARLQGANLQGARLQGANLQGARLQGARLQGANLQGANLQDADLLGANLQGANLQDANLQGADLLGANLQGVAESMGIVISPDLPAKILEQITLHPETWRQEFWHNECGTAHCIAGWAIQLSGDLGKYLETSLGTLTAAILLLWREGCPLPSFAAGADRKKCLARLSKLTKATHRDATRNPLSGRAS
jgi:uncharacterized protein YjbI with pentapeptide repeats